MDPRLIAIVRWGSNGRIETTPSFSRATWTHLSALSKIGWRRLNRVDSSIGAWSRPLIAMNWCIRWLRPKPLINSSSDLIEFQRYLKNFPNYPWIWPLFTTIPFNTWINLYISKFGLCFDMTLCVFNDRTISSRQAISLISLLPWL